MRNFFSDTWQLYLRNLQSNIRMPVWVLVNLFEPLLWLFLFSQIFQSVALMPGFPTENYIQFFAPGIIVMSVFFSSAWSGMSIIYEWKTGEVDRMLVTPANRFSLLLGRVLFHTSTGVAQGLIILFLALMMGATLVGGVPGFLVLSVTMIALGIAFSSFSFALSSLLRNEDSVVVTLNLFLLPLFFLSSAMMPQELMAGWLVPLIAYNPVNWAIEVVRAVMVSGGAENGKWFVDLVRLIIFSLIIFLASTRIFIRRTE